ncbi:glycosyltransferase family 2 protein [Sulfurimonas xiamenensis]|uniref:Glycosyltransferase family 2 protein n=1 Tax=Sulfurimonas xiamenensis TaxID=2590021 RepID=A0AAJ4A287_9BACT|nr:glycosyltransferase family 2 protein [Sulfurimonas xiamenensis]QFR42554.1 glycosyltransferase family 2 protein [Sulfurimonas xiamenensis]
MKIYGVVVLYNPDESIIKNINSYLNSLKKIYIVDNSEEKNIDLINRIKEISYKCEYIDNYGNKGIAHALNVGAKLAIKNGADWLLTMDQDTSFNNNDLEKTTVELFEIDINKIAVVAPSHYIGDDTKPFYNEIVMTSGNLLNLHLFQKIGEFDEKLFIDSVDTEYCLRIYSMGYKIKRISSIILKHNLGDIKKYKICGIKFRPTNHTFIRRYYIVRNRFYTWDKYKNLYPAFVKWEKIATFKQLIKIILFEKDKLKKIIFSFRGYFDYRKGRFGKYEK